MNKSKNNQKTARDQKKPAQASATGPGKPAASTSA